MKYDPFANRMEAEELGACYEAAWDEWERSGQDGIWSSALDDGIE